MTYESTFYILDGGLKLLWLELTYCHYILDVVLEWLLLANFSYLKVAARVSLTTLAKK